MRARGPPEPGGSAGRCGPARCSRVIGLTRLARTARKYPRPALSLAGTAVTVAGISLPSEPVLISGFVILLVALFLPGPASAPAKPCSARLWAHPLTPFAPSARYLPPSG